jgi:hypothetical protein
MRRPLWLRSDCKERAGCVFVGWDLFSAVGSVAAWTMQIRLCFRSSDHAEVALRKVSRVGQNIWLAPRC